MNETNQVAVEPRLSDENGAEEQRKLALLKDMGSTGEVAVEKSLGLNTQDEAMEFAATTQAVDQPNIPPPEDVYVPPETVQAEATEGAQEQEEEEKKMPGANTTQVKALNSKIKQI